MSSHRRCGSTCAIPQNPGAARRSQTAAAASLKPTTPVALHDRADEASSASSINGGFEEGPRVQRGLAAVAPRAQQPQRNRSAGSSKSRPATTTATKMNGQLQSVSSNLHDAHAAAVGFHLDVKHRTGGGGPVPGSRRPVSESRGCGVSNGNHRRTSIRSPSRFHRRPQRTSRSATEYIPCRCRVAQGRHAATEHQGRAAQSFEARDLERITK
jgi:hypothetical protein